MSEILSLLGPETGPTDHELEEARAEIDALAELLARGIADKEEKVLAIENFKNEWRTERLNDASGMKSWISTRKFCRDIDGNDMIDPGQVLTLNGMLKIEELVIPSHMMVEAIYCSNNKIKKIDLRGCSNLTHVVCSNNQSTEIELPKEGVLKFADVSDNSLRKLALGYQQYLSSLFCRGNKITDLDISERTCPVLTTCSFDRDKFKPERLGAIDIVILANRHKLSQQMEN